MNSYKKFAFAIKILSMFIILFTIFMTFAIWFYPEFYKSLNPQDNLLFDSSKFSMGQKICGFIIQCFSSSLIIFALLLIIKLMNCIIDNEYFSLRTINLLYKIAKLALIYAIYTPIYGSILSIITSFNNKPGERYISLTIGTTDFWNILIFCFIFLAVTILQKGYEIKHEQEFTI